MKILMIAPTPFFSDRGCHIRIYEEAKALSGSGHQVKIVTYSLGRDLKDIDIERIAYISWYKEESPGFSFHKFYLDILLFLKSLEVSFNFKPDLIHSHLHEGVVLGKIISILLRVPLFFDMQGSLVWELYEDGKIKRKGLFFKMCFLIEKIIDKFADRIIVSSKNLKHTLINEFGLDEKKIDILDDGVDIEMFANQNAGFREKAEIPPFKKVVIYAGTLSRIQGIDLLIKAAPKLIAEEKDIHFLIGGYPDEKKYEKMAEDLKIGNYFTFIGKVLYEDIPLFLAAGDVAVAPKLSETEANGKIMLYLAAGLPVISFDTPVNRDILKDKGLYAKENNSKELANTLIWAIKNYDEINKMRPFLKEMAKKEFAWRYKLKDMEMIYSKEIVK